MGLLKTGTQLVKSLFTTPNTNTYPKGEANITEKSRGMIVIDEDMCTLCGLCSRRCPAGAITVGRNEGNWFIDRMKCIACGECVYECPENCLKMVKEYVVPEKSVVIDVFSARAVPDSDSVLDGIEMPPAYEDKLNSISGSPLKLRDVQRRRRRNKRNKNSKKKKRTAHRNKRR